MKRLVDISYEMEQISGHECAFEGESFLVGFKDSIAPVDDVDGIDILLVLGHALEGEIRVVNAASGGSYMLVK